MGDYHILDADQYGNSFRVVMHFPVADVDNEASVSYRTAIVEWQGGAPIESVLPNPGTEQAQLDAGELYERAYAFNSNPNETLIQKRDRLDAMWAERQAAVQAELVKVLGFWGFDRDIP